MKNRRSIVKALLVLCLAALLGTSALAAEREVTFQDVVCFSPADFSAEDGLLLTAVPEDSLGQLQLGARILKAGDVLTPSQLSEMTFVPSGTMEGDAVISCLGRSSEGALSQSEMTLKIGSGKNEPPVAEDSQFTTYKNIPGEIVLTASDPEGDELTVTIVKEPKRGALTLGDGVTVTYTPQENKVGKDSFTYTVTDAAGNTSEEATVRIQIEKPSDKQTYGDLQDHPALLAATWLREEGIYTGRSVSGQLLFEPDEPLTRGEFIAMCVSLTGLQEEDGYLMTGFADDSETPQWLSPYVSTALRCGYISGVPTDQGLKLMSGCEITQAEAAKLVSNLLALPQSDLETVMGQENTIPAWASGAAAALSQADLYTVTNPSATLTRGEAAQLLYGAFQEAERNAEESSLLAWAKE